jgi:uncharacterized protein YdhG (YjbR/CyaY superfamily)
MIFEGLVPLIEEEIPRGYESALDFAKLKVLRAALLECMAPRKKMVNEVDVYISKYPPNTRKVLQKIRKAVKEAAPKAEEVISYKMPGYKQNGMLVWFAGFKDHIGFFPKVSPFETFSKELAPYKSGVATAKFPLNIPIPLALVKRIVRFRVRENLKKK